MADWKRHLEAVQIVAEKDASAAELAVAFSVDIDVAQGWLDSQEFKNEVKRFRQIVKDRLKKEGIRAKENRLAAQHHRWEALKFIVKERKEDFKDKGIPGGESGFITRRYVKDGINYEFDEKLFDAFLKLEAHVGKAMGDIVERSDVTSDGKPLAAWQPIVNVYASESKPDTECEPDAESGLESAED